LSLTTVNFEADCELEEIGGFAFSKSTIREIEIPKSVKTIDNYSFYECLSLTEVTFEPDSNLTRIFANAFFRTNVRSFIIPEKVVEIGDYALNNAATKSVTILSSEIKNLGKNVFFKKTKIISEGGSNIVTTADNLVTCIINNAVNQTSNNHKTEMSQCTDSDTSVPFGNLIKYKETQNSHASIPESIEWESRLVPITEIDDYAFSRALLEKVTFSESLEKIGSYAFHCCRQLTTVEFKEESKLCEICEEAFSASGLRKIKIPVSVKIIGTGAFQKCQLLAEVTFEAGSKLTSIGQRAFSGTIIKHIEIPANVKTIGDYALSCESLVEVVFEKNSELISIGNGVFKKTAITKIILPKLLESLGDYVFQNCESLESVVFESEFPLKHRGKGLFSGAKLQHGNGVPKG
jgi:hypothetical protein